MGRKTCWKTAPSFFLLDTQWLFLGLDLVTRLFLNLSVPMNNSVHFQPIPGEMKKVLQSFLSRVTSRISLVMLTSLPATGGTRRKSRTLQDTGTLEQGLAFPVGTEGEDEGVGEPVGHESKLQQDINGTAACALNTVGIQWLYRH